MKKLLIIINLFIVIVLSGCSKRFNLVVELSDDNFNEHFNLDFEFIEEDGIVYLLVNLSPRFDLSINNIDLHVTFYYYYLLNKNDLIFLSSFTAIVFDNPDEDGYQQKLEIGRANRLNNIQPKNYRVTNCSGEISTYKTPKYKTKGFVTNKRDNRKALAEMLESLSEFETFYDSNYIDLNMTVSAKKLYRGGSGELVSNNAYTKLRTDPFYLETYTALGKGLIKQENDEYFRYTFGDGNYVSKEPIPMEDVNNNIKLGDLLEFADIDISFEYNSDKMLIEKQNEGYLISGYYKDFLNKEQYEVMFEMFENIDSNPEIMMKNAIFKMYIFADENGIYMDLTLDIFAYESVYLYSTRVIMDIVLNEFKEIDLEGGIYYVLPAYDIDSVKYKSDFSNIISGFKTADEHVYLTYLEAGQYIINDIDYRINQVKIYNKDKEAINHVMSLQNFGDVKFTFPIDESGEYYFEFIFREIYWDAKYRFRVSKINNTELTGLTRPITINEGIINFSIDDIYNIIAMRYYANEIGLLFFGSLENNFAGVYPSDITIIDKDTLNLTNFIYSINDYENVFYVYGDIDDYKYEITYYKKDKYQVNNPPILVEPFEWIEQLVLSAELPDSYIAIEVESGFIKFEAENEIGNRYNLVFDLYDENWNKINDVLMWYNWEYFVEGGKYYLKIRSSDYIITNLRYTFRGVDEE